MGRLPGLALFGIMEEESGSSLELWDEDEGPEEEGSEGGPGPPQDNVPFFLFFPLSFKFFRGCRVAEESPA